MITLTFQFTDIAAAAALLGKLNGTELGAIGQPSLVEAPAPKPQAPAKPAKAAPAAPTAPSTPTAAPTAPSEAPAAPAPSTPKPAAEQSTAAPAAATSVGYPDLQKAVLALHKMDPTAAQPIARNLGAETFKLLKPEQWTEALRLVNEAIVARG